MDINQFITGSTYFAWIGTFYLIYLSYQDIKNNMEIDDRKNYFMLGIAISLFSHFHHTIWYILAIILVTTLLDLFLNKFKVLGKGDLNCVRWVFLGFAIINIFYMAWFLVIMTILTIFIISLKKALKIEKPTPYFPVILSAFFINCFILGIY